MACLADEVFLSFEWEGRAAWMNRLLEAQLYGTHVAGEQVFEEVEGLLRDRQDAERELAQVYLLALSLGFQGRYRGSSDPRPLQDVRERLLAFVNRGAPTLDDPRRSLSPQPYAHTLGRDVDALLPPTRRWLMALVLAVGVYVTVGHLLWQDVAGPLGAVTKSLEQMQEMAR
jgi:type VI secretion system protein ImpK